ncbi:hypothetical protein ARSQ2_00787 [Arsenophonus endosymbiont of Bemisia tabaci Q2]|nr:hypothetical protein ARSQ2_00787 [Arsenophonus endosymbiont of Bemisia tabaci Q2]
MPRKVKVTFSAKQKLEYAKLIVEGGYCYIQVEKIAGAAKSAVSRCKQQYLSELNRNTPIKSKVLRPEQQRTQELEVKLKRAQRDNDILKKLRFTSSSTIKTQNREANENYVPQFYGH